MTISGLDCEKNFIPYLLQKLKKMLNFVFGYNFVNKIS